MDATRARIMSHALLRIQATFKENKHRGPGENNSAVLLHAYTYTDIYILYGKRTITPVSSTRKLMHRHDMTLAVAQVLNPNKPMFIIHTCMHNYTYIHIHTCTCIIYTYRPTDIHRAYIHTYIHTCIHTHIHTHTYTHTYIHTHTLHTYIHIHYIHTYIHTHTYTHTLHTYIHIHTYIYIHNVYIKQLSRLERPCVISKLQDTRRVFSLFSADKNTTSTPYLHYGGGLYGGGTSLAHSLYHRGSMSVYVVSWIEVFISSYDREGPDTFSVEESMNITQYALKSVL